MLIFNNQIYLSDISSFSLVSSTAVSPSPTPPSTTSNNNNNNFNNMVLLDTQGQDYSNDGMTIDQSQKFSRCDVLWYLGILNPVTISKFIMKKGPSKIIQEQWFWYTKSWCIGLQHLFHGNDWKRINALF